jgi:uncharacterized protein YegL
MMGEPIEAVKNGVQTMASALRQDPYALETAYLSIITFNSTANQLVPLTELTSFQTPLLDASGTTSFGAALTLIANIAQTEVKKTTTEAKGDWKPIVFIMTDGMPTDDWQKGLADFQKQKWGMVVACAAGQAVDTSILKQITEVVVQLDTADSASFKAFFKWVSSSISTQSSRIIDGVVSSDDNMAGLNELPPPPPEVNVVL